ncbi:MAG: hypothetical protein J7L57_04720 [Deltaproteobacteria bacterium]|nr:hypothetical protein [Candidatus Tharpella sp.]
MPSHTIKQTAPLPLPWQKLSYKEIMTRPDGQLINGGRASRVYRFIDGNEVCFLKRYTYQKIHWQHCWQKSQVRREFENLEKIKRADLGCNTIEVLAYGEQRRCRILIDAFILSREVAGNERLSLFLGSNHDHPQRQLVVEKVIQLGQKVIESGLAITDLFFRNLVVVPKDAGLYLLDVQYCNRNRRRAEMKTYPQLWSNILLFFTPDEQNLAAKILLPHLPYNLNELELRAQQFSHKEKKRKATELAFIENNC